MGSVQSKTGQKMKNVDENFKKKWQRFFPRRAITISLHHFLIYKSLYVYFILLFLTKIFAYKKILHSGKVTCPRLHG